MTKWLVKLEKASKTSFKAHATPNSILRQFIHPLSQIFRRVKMVYIRQDKLPRLKEYKYSGVDHSLLSRYVLKPFYTKVVIHFFPMSMAYVYSFLRQVS